MILADADIRVLTLEDFPVVAALEMAAHPLPWTVDVLGNSLGNHYRRWGLWRDKHLLAMAFFQVVAPEVELLNLAVSPGSQGCGVGRSFLHTLLQQFHTEGIARCFLEVRASNVSAIRLYEHLGFNQMGVRPRYYPSLQGREDAHLYALELECLV